MAEPTLGALVKRVEALEEENSRLKGLASGGAVLLEDGQGLPTRDAYEVRSEITGAAIGRHDVKGDAARECDRLNDQCRREGVKHLGEAMRYEVVHVVVVDEDAAHVQRIDGLKKIYDNTDDDAHRERVQSEIDALEEAFANG